MSTDYAACEGNECPIKENCHRFTGPRSPHYQSWFSEIPGKWIKEAEFEPDSAARWQCEMYWAEPQTTILNQLKDIVNQLKDSSR